MSSARGLPDPRTWLGASPYPWPAASTLGAGDALAGCYAVVSIQLLRTRQDKPYLKVQLMDCHGPLEARVWDGAEQIVDALPSGSYVGVRGRIEIFNNERQLKVETIEPVRVEFEDLRLFLPRSRRPVEVMEAETRALLDSIGDAALRELLDRLLGEETETGRAFRLAPAAKHNHHACIGGLWEHSLSVATVCSMLSSHYGAVVDRDLVVAAALIHDIGKIREIGAQPGFPYTDEGKLLGHILIGLQIVSDAARQVAALPANRRMLLEHLVASHQGRYEWQSPREPRILEGIILHYADDLDAKMQQIGNLLDATSGGWTAYDRSMQREFLRHIRADGGGGESEGEPAAAPVARVPQRGASTPGAGDVAGGGGAGSASAARAGGAGSAGGGTGTGQKVSGVPSQDAPPSYADEPEPVAYESELQEIAADFQEMPAAGEGAAAGRTLAGGDDAGRHDPPARSSGAPGPSEAGGPEGAPDADGGGDTAARRAPRIADDSLDLFGG